MGGLLHLVQRGGALAPGGLRPRPVPSPLYQNVTAHPSMASVPVTVLLYTMVRCSVVFAVRFYASAALAVMRCLCVSVTFVHCVKTNEHIFKFFTVGYCTSERIVSVSY